MPIARRQGNSKATPKAKAKAKAKAKPKPSTSVANAGVSILHITDIHAGQSQLRDEDAKIKISGAERAKQLTRLGNYLAALSAPPDYVVVTGDITIQGGDDGLQEFRTWLQDQIKLGRLPPRERIVVTPGNHDVARSSLPNADVVRFERFWNSFGTFVPHAHIPGYDPPPDVKTLKPSSSERGLLGGIEVELVDGKVKLAQSYPFILDLDRDVLIFAFNSAHGCGSRLDPNPAIVGALEGLQKIHPSDAESAPLATALNTYRDSLVIDAGLITDSQLEQFENVMAKLRNDLGNRYDRITKIACLHHHVTHLWAQQLELKTFEFTLDAAQLKRSLIENGFDIVLHGHKHQNHVGLDGSLIPVSEKAPFNPLCIVSGGSVGGYPRIGDYQSFKLITLDGPIGPRARALIQEVKLGETGNHASALKQAKIYHAPIARKLPQLHDLQRLKEALDESLITDLASNVKTKPRLVNGKTPTRTSNILRGNVRYRCHAEFVVGKNQRVLCETFLATRPLGFSHLARLRWLLEDAQATEGCHVLVLIGNLERTHFFEGFNVGEVRDSISHLKRDLAPSLKSKLLEIRERTFTQGDLDRVISSLAAS